jgi:glutamine amidotransferase
MSGKVALIDYGLCNLLSVSRAFRYCGFEPYLVSSPEEIRQATRMILPGVGAFEMGMAGLRTRGLIEPILDYAKSGRPLLGICLGMQMLFDESEEFGVHPGLGLISGRVTAIPNTTADGRPHKIPHIGWAPLELPAESRSDRWAASIFSTISPGDSVYFVHSFTASPSNLENRLSDSLYNGRRISAGVQSGKIFGCQFHPEKSGETGLRIIRAFMGLT